MAVRNYEGMFLLDSSRFAQDPAGTEQEVADLLEKVGAELVVAAPFQDGKLAYEIEGRRKGLHYLTYFKVEGAQIEELHRLSRLSEIVLRLLVIEHKDVLFNAFVEAYQGHAGASETEEEVAEPAEAVAS